MIPNLRHSGRSSDYYKHVEESPRWAFVYEFIFCPHMQAMESGSLPRAAHAVSPCRDRKQNWTMGDLCCWTFQLKTPHATFSQTAEKKSFLMLDTLRLVYTILNQLIDEMKNLLKLVIW